MHSLEYRKIVVESYYESGSGLHGDIHVRPLPGQDPYLPSMRVAFTHDCINDYPVGTRFRIKAKITSRRGGPPFIYSHYKWPFEILSN